MLKKLKLSLNELKLVLTTKESSRYNNLNAERINWNVQTFVILMLP